MYKAATLCLCGPQQSPAPHFYVAFLSWWQLELLQSPFTRLSSSKKGSCDPSLPSDCCVTSDIGGEVQSLLAGVESDG